MISKHIIKSTIPKEIKPKASLSACDGDAKNASPRDAAPSYCGIECSTQTDRVSVCERQRIGSGSLPPALCSCLDKKRGNIERIISLLPVAKKDGFLL